MKYINYIVYSHDNCNLGIYKLPKNTRKKHLQVLLYKLYKKGFITRIYYIYLKPDYLDFILRRSYRYGNKICSIVFGDNCFIRLQTIE